MITKTLDLGCGETPKNPYNADKFYGIDIANVGNDNIRIADLAFEKIPFENSVFDYVTGYDFIEHIPRIFNVNGKRTQPFIDLMSEVSRVLKVGGIARFHTPAYPHPEAFQDPQHVNVITEKTVNYFVNPTHSNNWDHYSIRLGRQYGFNGAFELISQHWDVNVPYHLVWELRCVK